MFGVPCFTLKHGGSGGTPDSGGWVTLSVVYAYGCTDDTAKSARLGSMFGEGVFGKVEAWETC